MDFTQPKLLYLFFLIIPLIIIFGSYFFWKKNIISKTFNHNIFLQIAPNYSSGLNIFHFTLKLLAILFLVIALSGPRIGTKIKSIKREGVDVVFVLDVSKSMLVEDVAPNRLLKSLQIVSKSIDRLVSDRVGIIVYAGQAYPLMPLSFDYSMAKLLVQTIDTDIVPSQGTDVSSALMLAESFFDQEEKSKILFIISDGEDHEGNYNSEIETLTTNNVIISSINIGTESGGPIPIRNNGKLNYKKDKNDNVIISKSNSKMLSSLASMSKGGFLKTMQTNDAVDFVLDNMASLDKSFSEEKFYSDYEDQYQWFLGFALFFIVIDFFLTRKKIKFIDKIIKR